MIIITKVVGVIPGAANEEDMFNKFEANAVESPLKASATPASATGASWCGAAVQSVTVAPGESKTVTFVLSWYFPNRPSYSARANLPSTLGNMYNNWFADAVDVCKQFATNQAALCTTTRKYRDTMYATSIPWSFLETAAGRLACMRSPTMFWTEKGVVLGNEGNNCCPLNCTHVYGYTTLLERYVAIDDPPSHWTIPPVFSSLEFDGPVSLASAASYPLPSSAFNADPE